MPPRWHSPGQRATVLARASRGWRAGPPGKWYARRVVTASKPPRTSKKPPRPSVPRPSPPRPSVRTSASSRKRETLTVESDWLEPEEEQEREAEGKARKKQVPPPIPGARLAVPPLPGSEARPPGPGRRSMNKTMDVRASWLDSDQAPDPAVAARPAPKELALPRRPTGKPIPREEEDEAPARPSRRPSRRPRKP